MKAKGLDKGRRESCLRGIGDPPVMLAVELYEIDEDGTSVEEGVAEGKGKPEGDGNACSPTMREIK